ncbi:hypothetical protein OQA88_11024 [Cercophora sp. LCS_1]
MLRSPHRVAIGDRPEFGIRGVWWMAKPVSKAVLSTIALLGMERGSPPSYLKYGISTTITIVSAIQGFLTAFVGVAVSQSLESLHRREPLQRVLVEPFMQKLKDLAPSYKYNTLPYSYYCAVQDLVINPFYSSAAQPLYCKTSNDQGRSDDCAAYLLSDGTIPPTPWTPSGFPDHSRVLMENVSMIHVEFSPVAPHKVFDDSTECHLFGSNKTIIAVKFCLAQSRPHKCW